MSDELRLDPALAREDPETDTLRCAISGYTKVVRKGLRPAGWLEVGEGKDRYMICPRFRRENRFIDKWAEIDPEEAMEQAAAEYRERHRREWATDSEE